MVQFSLHTVYNEQTSRTKMQNGSSKTGRGVTVNGNVSTLKRQPRPKISSSRLERGSCSSTVSCPVFSACESDPDEEPPPRCPSSLSSPTLHGSGSVSSLKGSSLQGSLVSVTGSAASLKSFPASNLRSGSSSFRSSSSSQRSCSSSEDDSWDTNSWSSGATCLLRSSIKQHSEEVFRVRAGSGGRPERTSDSETGYQNSESFPGSVLESGGQDGDERVAVGRRDSVQSLSSSQGTSATSTSTDIEQKIEAKLKFSQFLDEVTCRVLDPECLQAFGAARQKETSQTSSVSCQHVTAPHSGTVSPWLLSFRDSLSAVRDSSNAAVSVDQWAQYLPSCKILDTSESNRNTREEAPFMQTSGRTYLETDIDEVRRENEFSPTHVRERETRTSKLSAEKSRRTLNGQRCSSPVSERSDGPLRSPYRSTSVPRPVSSSTASDGVSRGQSSFQDQREDLRKRLTVSAHKLGVMEDEFDSTRQYLETELRRAQDELEKFTDKLQRIQSSYAALQRINQDLEDKIQRTAQHHDEERRDLSREIFILKNHLMEAKITIQKLREDNELYRKDCNLAAQLLQCEKSHYRGHELSELPTDFQERVSSHMEKQANGRTVAQRHSSRTDAVPTAVIAKVLQKPEPGRSCPVTHSPSPLAPDAELLPGCGVGVGDRRRVACKLSDVYCSDTALYCPSDDRRHDRWPERRQSVDIHGRETSRNQNSTDINLEQESFHLSFSEHEEPFPVPGSLLASRSYSSFSAALDEKDHLSSSQQLVDWRSVDCGQTSSSSYEKENDDFFKSHSFKHVSLSSQDGSSLASARTPSCYSEPNHTPRLSSSGAHRDSCSSVHVPEDQLTDCWRQLSLEDFNSFSFCRPGRVSPHSFSEQHIAVGPTKIRLAPVYNRLQEGDDIFHTHTLESRFPASTCSSPVLNPKTSLNLVKPPKGAAFRSGRTREKQSAAESSKKDHVNEIPSGSAESLNQSLEASRIQHYRNDPQSPGAQTHTNTGLSRKDSLTKAQLYGTLLN